MNTIAFFAERPLPLHWSKKEVVNVYERFPTQHFAQCFSSWKAKGHILWECSYFSDGEVWDFDQHSWHWSPSTPASKQVLNKLPAKDSQ